MHSQMNRCFLRLHMHGMVNDAFICALETNSHWIQTVNKLLKSRGLSYVISSHLSVNKNNFHKEFYTRFQDRHILESRQSSPTKTSDYRYGCLDLSSYEFKKIIRTIENDC